MLTANQLAFLKKAGESLANKPLTRPALESIGRAFGLTDKQEVKELTELAIVLQCHVLTQQAREAGWADRRLFDAIVALYERQPNLSLRTSLSVMLQQYSTAPPLAWLAGWFCFQDARPGATFFEPSAGNGMLAIAAPDAETGTVNEIDATRRANLEMQGYMRVLSQDATKPFKMGQFDVVLTNPPFGSCDPVVVDGFKITSLEQAMTLNALGHLQDDGRAGIIIGGHTEWDEHGRIQAGKNRIFFNLLHKHYHVVDVINVDGKKLYSRMGTGFNVRLILINGRKATPGGVAPLHDPARDVVVRNYPDLFERVRLARLSDALLPPLTDSGFTPPPTPDRMKLLRLKAKAATAKLLLQQQQSATASLGRTHQVLKRQEKHKVDKTSIKQAPAIFNLIPWAAGTRNADVGGGKYDLGSQRIAAFGVKNIIYDPFSRPDTYEAVGKLLLRKPADTGTLANVLNVIEDAENRLNALRDTAHFVKRGGKVYVGIYAGNNKGIGAETSSGTWQNNRPLKTYLNEVRQVFPDAKITNGYIVGTVPGGLSGLGCVPQWGMAGLGMPYRPASNACVTLNTDVPDAMGAETHDILKRVREAVGGDFDVFVADRLNYPGPKQLCAALSAEQTDAVALAIYNIEARQEGMIVGDQTGIGKGRVAAAIIRYGVERGLKPVFLTEKPNLFSDLYRDLVAIGSARLRPLIVNAKEDKTSVKDADGKVIYSAPEAGQLKAILKTGKVPAGYDYVMATYSQFNAALGNDKKGFLQAVSRGTILVLDEAHNTSGASNVGVFMQNVVAAAAGVLFLSATFAKRPDNMPIYAAATAMRETGLNNEELVGAITEGGVALQEVISSQLVAEGQMLRRERHIEGMEVNYLVLEEKEEEHRAIADNITTLVRGITEFQREHIEPAIAAMDKDMAAEGKEAGQTKGTSKAGVDNSPYFSKVFQVVNQMLFAIKAEAVADRAIMRLKEGKKPVIAFSSTMGSFLEQLTNNNGGPVGPGDVIPIEFSSVLRRGLEGVMRYTVTLPDGTTEKKTFGFGDLNNAAQAAYDELHQLIRHTTSGITLSPIDVIVKRLTQAGYKVAEVTGRKFAVALSNDGKTGTVETRKKENTADAFRKFNDNEIDVLLINQSGSTGASAHAIATAKVSAAQVRQRVMIVLQAELDINTEVQKRGRINRTGQLLKPIYDYVSSAIPAEKRLNMMLRKKLKSLDANTSSNQKNSSTMLAGEDFLNKYGDQVVTDYLLENPELISALGLEKSEKAREDTNDITAHKVSGRIAVMPTAVQAAFYDEVNQRYADLVGYLRETNEYDLELEAQDLKTKTTNSEIVEVGGGGRSAFGGDVVMEKVEMNALKKPLTLEELQNEVQAALGGRTALEIVKEQYQQLVDAFKIVFQDKAKEINEWAAKLRDELKNDRDELLKVDELLRDKHQKAKQQIQSKFDYLVQFISSGHEYNYGPSFKIGHDVLVPTGKDTAVTGVFLGFAIDTRLPNPFVPSKIKLRVAVPTSLKRLNIPLSMPEARALKPMRGTDAMRTWAESVKSRSADRTTGYIITGNLLLGLAKNSGRLISYTTLDGGVRKGILKPDGWEPGKEGNAKPVMVPVLAAEKTLLALPVGQMLTTNVQLTFFRRYDGFKVLVPGSKAKGGHLFLAPALLDIVGRFEKVGDKMQAQLNEDDLPAFLAVLGRDFGATLAVSRAEGEKAREARDAAQSGTATGLPRLPATTRKAAPAAAAPAANLKLLQLKAKAAKAKLLLQAQARSRA